MKKNILIVVAVALIGAVTLTVSSLRAQNEPPAPGAPPAGQPPRQPLQGMRGRPNMGYRQAIFLLKRAKLDLARDKNDYDGHRQSAMDACDKAVQELEAVQNAILAKAAAAKAAADAAQPTPPAQPPPVQAAPPSPAPQQ